jgi:hypothetical protein
VGRTTGVEFPAVFMKGYILFVTVSRPALEPHPMGNKVLLFWSETAEA